MQKNLFRTDKRVKQIKLLKNTHNMLWFVLIEDFIKILDEINYIIELNDPNHKMIKYIKDLYNITDITIPCLRNSIQKLFLKIIFKNILWFSNFT